MTDPLDAVWDAEPEAAVSLVPPTPRRHRHQWRLDEYQDDPQSRVLAAREVCRFCGTVKDVERSRRGRRSLRAGKDAERAIAKAYGGKRTGQYGGPDDVQVGELFVIQSKAGGWFSERVWAELRKLPRVGGRVPLLIVSDRPPSGVHARRYVVIEMTDHVALHGPVGAP